MSLLKTAIFGLLLLGAPCLGAIDKASSVNELKDIWLERSSHWVTIVFALDKRAAWELSPLAEGGAEIVIHSVKVGQRSEARIVEDNTRILEAFVQDSLTFRCKVNLKKPLRQMEYSFNPKDNFLAYKLYWPLPSQKIRRYANKAVVLKNLRYGKRPTCDRIVMEFTGKPMWSAIQTTPLDITIRISGCKVGSVGRLLSPRLIKSFSCKPSGSDVYLHIAAAKPLCNFRIFWLEVGNRLVVDVMPAEQAEMVSASMLPKDFGRPMKEQSLQPQPVVANNSRQRHTDTLTFKPIGVSVLEKIGSGAGHKITQKIARPVSASFAPTTHSSKQKQSVVLSMTKKEAVAYGRILGALNFKEYEKGIALIDKFLSRYPNSTAREGLLFMKGDFYLHLMELGGTDKLYATLAAFKKAVKTYPRSKQVPAAYLKMARASRLGGDFYGAMGYLNLLLEKYKEGKFVSTALVERALVYEKLQLVDKAFQDYNTVIRRFPSSPACARARLGIAKYLHNKGLYDEADKWFAEIKTNHPGFGQRNPEFYMLRAKNDLYLKRFSTARRLFLLALNLGVRDEPAESILTRIGDTYLYQGNKKAAKKIYTFVVTHFPESEAVSIAQLRLADLTAGLKKFKELHDRYGDSPLGELALLKLASVYFKSKAYDKAMESLRELVLKPPKDEAGKAARALFYQACEEAIRQAYEEKRLQDCIDLYRKNQALVADKLGMRTRLYVAEALFEEGAADQSLAVLGRFDPDSLMPRLRPRYIMVFAKALRAAGHVKRAVRILEEQKGRIRDELFKAKCSLFLGQAYEELGLLSEALKAYKHGIANFPLLSKEEKLKVLLEVGKIQNRMGNTLEAKGALRRCLELAGKAKEYDEIRLSALVELADTYGSSNNLQEAVKILEDLFKQGYGPEGEHYWEIKFRLAQYYEQLGRNQRAKELYTEVGDEGPPILQARAQMRLGDIVLYDNLKKLPHWADVANR